MPKKYSEPKSPESVVNLKVNNKPWFEEIPEQVYPSENRPSGKKKPWFEEVPDPVYPPENKPSGKKKPFEQ